MSAGTGRWQYIISHGQPSVSRVYQTALLEDESLQAFRQVPRMVPSGRCVRFYKRSDASESVTALLAASLVHRGLHCAPVSVFSSPRSSLMYVLLKFEPRIIRTDTFHSDCQTRNTPPAPPGLAAAVSTVDVDSNTPRQYGDFMPHRPPGKRFTLNFGSPLPIPLGVASSTGPIYTYLPTYHCPSSMETVALCASCDGTGSVENVRPTYHCADPGERYWDIEPQNLASQIVEDFFKTPGPGCI
ncbi:hypothetical protein C8R44DRAFT_62289 [Mycena epipterygia]|nr:hypothetical protein C8R44DRAFT_62289 [Mycena epipterygia]